MELANNLLLDALNLLSAWLPGGKLNGREYKCANLKGGSGDSLSVNTNSGVWCDFATGEKGCNLISLYSAIRRISYLDSAKELSGEFKFSGKAEPKPIKVRTNTVPPAGAKTNYFKLNGEIPTMIFTYRDEDGKPLFYITRYKNKVIRPWTWKKNKWVMGGWSPPRPLYGLEILTNRKNDTILLVEGEKSANAARVIAGKHYVVLTWPNGASAINSTNWYPLVGRKVLIWPDADKPGIEAAEKIARTIYCKKIGIIDVPADGNGWDAADALEEGWDWKKFKKWVRGKIKIYE